MSRSRSARRGGSALLLTSQFSHAWPEVYLEEAGWVNLGFAAGGFLPLLGAIVGRHFGPAAFGQVMGLVGPFTTLAAVGPWVAGYLRDSLGSYDIAWQIFALVLLPAAMVIMLLKPTPATGTAQPATITSG